jgi:suppressor of G2 allele of SKP1
MCARRRANQRCRETTFKVQASDTTCQKTKNMAQVPGYTWFQTPDGIEVNVMVKRRPDQISVDVSGADASPRLTVCVHAESCVGGAGADAACKCDSDLATCSYELWGSVVPSSMKVEVLSSKVEIKLAKKLAGEMWPRLEKGEEPQAAVKAKPAKNWDKIEDEVDDDEQGKDAMGFFQHLFAGADDDTRRAMMKSYVESNGTSLSTNWDEVKSKDFSKES